MVDRRFAVLLAGVLRALAAGRNAIAQTPALEWEDFVDGAAHGNDLGMAVAISAAGDVYTTGQEITSTENSVYRTTMYDGDDGSVVWTATYGPGGGLHKPHAIAVDDEGYVHVTGESPGNGLGLDIATLKHEPDGDVASGWPRRWHNPSVKSASDDIGYDLVVDGDGNVYVTGTTWNGASGYDYATIRYEGDGTWVWDALENGAGNGRDVAVDIELNPPLSEAVDAVYITDTSYSGGSDGYDYLTIRYDASDGSVDWSSLYDGGTGTDSAVGCVALGRGMYVTGWSEEESETTPKTDYVTIKYNKSDGSEFWVERYDESDDDMAVAIAGTNGLNGDHIYVTGRVETSDVTAIRTVRYDTDGVPATDIAGEYDGDGDDHPYAIGVDPEVEVQGGEFRCRIFVVGRTMNAGGNYDFIILRYNNHWFPNASPPVETYVQADDPVPDPGPGGGHDWAMAVAVRGGTWERAGNFGVAGAAAETGSDQDMCTQRWENPDD